MLQAPMAKEQKQEETFSLRPANPEDLDRIVELEEAFSVAPWSLGNFQEELQKSYSRFLVVTDDETDTQICGYIVYWFLEGQYWIHNLVVELQYRGKGLAKKMIRQVVNDAIKDQARRVGLEVRKSNHSAIQLYQGLGFTITSIRKKFYSDGEDAYQMEVDLAGPQIAF